VKIQLVFLLSTVLSHQICAQSFDERNTTVSQVSLNITNAGTIGNAFGGNFDNGFPSCEYPRGSGVEHLFEGGLWVGGKLDGSQVVVSTAAYDYPRGINSGTGTAGYEFFAPEGSSILERSSFFNSPAYSVDAISHQDFVMDFTDRFQVVPGTQIQVSQHDFPIGLDVHLEAYNWNFPFSDFFVLLNYTITNNGTSTLDEAYIALWANTVVRNTNITPAGQGGSAFYNKGGNGFIDSLNMAYCYDNAGDVGFTESYIGQRFLGATKGEQFFHPKVDSSFVSNYQAWIFNNSSDPVFFIPSDDNQRYAKMSNGMNKLSSWPPSSPPNGSSLTEQLNNAGNRADLVSVGPFPTWAPGESINIAFAVVLAKKNEDGQPNSENNPTQQKFLIQNAEWAQTAFNGEDGNFNGILDPDEDKDGDGKITRFILPSPPDIPNTKVVAGDGRIDIYWSDNAEESIDPISLEKDFEGYRVYASTKGYDVADDQDLSEALKIVGEFDLAGNQLFFDNGMGAIRQEPPVIFDGDSNEYLYKYSLEGLTNGWQYAVAVTAFDRGDENNNLASLETSPIANSSRAFAGKEANPDIKTNLPFAYPNPYYLGASWEGSSTSQETKKLVFANLPERCIIRIYNISGDLIDEIEHDQNYDGSDIRWYQSYSDVENTVFSGGEHSWDLLSTDQQIIARGIYVFSVEDLDTGNIQKGNFTVIK
jgi:hypothetical protein